MSAADSGQSVGNRELDVLAAEAGTAAAAAFAQAGWTWGGFSSEEYTPAAAALAVTLRRLMADCKLGSSISTGRLTVERFTNEDDQEQVTVSLDLGSAKAAQ